MPTDVPIIYPRTQRTNWVHREEVNARLSEIGFEPHDVLPPDFHRRHWRDQQRYFELVLGTKFCVRCKLPTATLTGKLCPGCNESNAIAWEAKRWNQGPTAERLHGRYLRRKENEQRIANLKLEWNIVASRAIERQRALAGDAKPNEPPKDNKSAGTILQILRNHGKKEGETK